MARNHCPVCSGIGVQFGQACAYNPDLIVIEHEQIHWVVEVKMDKEIASADVVAKRDAAKRWANHVCTDEKVTVPWRYLFVSESDIKESKGSWNALKNLGS